MSFSASQLLPAINLIRQTTRTNRACVRQLGPSRASARAHLEPATPRQSRLPALASPSQRRGLGPVTRRQPNFVAGRPGDNSHRGALSHRYRPARSQGRHQPTSGAPVYLSWAGPAIRRSPTGASSLPYPALVRACEPLTSVMVSVMCGVSIGIFPFDKPIAL